MLVAADIETKCKTGCTKSCDHALIPHLNQITCIGVWSPTFQHVFRNRDEKLLVAEFDEWVSSGAVTGLVNHNMKWDLKNLILKGSKIDKGLWKHDSQIQAHASITKVSQEYFTWYEAKRKELNKAGARHREAGLHSLKTLAPYFLDVEPFWETNDHDNDEYVLKDAEYSYRLYEFFSKQLKLEKSQPSDKETNYDFYINRLMPWAHMLLDTELRGITLDLDLLARKKADAEKRAQELKEELDKKWQSAYIKYFDMQCRDLQYQYAQMVEKQIEKAKDKSIEKIGKIKQRYLDLYTKACAKVDRQINLDSPKQLAWLMKDYLGLDITDFNGEESTGVEVLEKHSAREDIKLFIEYRGQQKLATAFFPTYEELANNGVLHCSFNSTGTKTGRLSSSNPNLQQVPGDLHSLFIARPGFKLVTRDASYIEPRLISYFTEDAMLCDITISDRNFHDANTKLMCGLDCEESEVKAKHRDERDLCKEIGLACLYGARVNRIQQSSTKRGFNWPTKHCSWVFNNLRETYHEAFDWKEELDRVALQRPIKNLFGRLRYYENPDEIYMSGFNSLIQSSASDLVLNAGYESMQEFKRKGIDAHLLLLVHDELVFEVPENQVAQCEEIIERNMTDYPLPTKYGNIPLKVEGKTSERWEK